MEPPDRPPAPPSAPPSAQQAESGRRVRVVVADDHRLMLDGIRRALEQDGGFEVVGETQNGTTVVALVADLRPDLVLLDVRMPQVDGLACLDEIHRRFPAIKVVMLSASTSPELVETAFRYGASSYLAKTVDPTELAADLRRVLAGEVLDATRGAGGEQPRTDNSGLTERELSILTAVARGLSNDEIARDLWITQQTVKFHLTNVFRKLGVKNRTEATHIAYQRGLIENPLLADDE